MRHISLFVLLFSSTVALAGSPALKRSGTLSKADAEMAAEMAQIGNSEVALNQFAENRAMAESVKSFTRTMITDHTANNLELANLLNSKGAAALEALPDSVFKTESMLQTLTGEPFDKKFMSIMVSGHQHAEEVLTKMAKNAADADLRGWAAKTLPTVRHHLEMAKMTATASR